MYQHKRDHFQPDGDDLRPIKGILLGLIISLGLWVGIIAAGIYLS